MSSYDLRVIDESGADYLYPASYFVRVELPRQTVHVLNKARERFAPSANDVI
ncbi:MAG: hypothetical protein HY741_30195 [Chloroflexi bacterium]|nr:hypothetical protein [Chloroflexota bacterium]